MTRRFRGIVIVPRLVSAALTPSSASERAGVRSAWTMLEKLAQRVEVGAWIASVLGAIAGVLSAVVVASAAVHLRRNERAQPDAS